jgi:hypothetical protein
MAKKSTSHTRKREYRVGVAKRQLIVQIKGSPDSGGYPRLSDFLKQLDAIKVALKQTERLHSHTDDSLVDYRIVRLSMSSPATVVLEEIRAVNAPRLPKIPITTKLVSAFSQIESGRSIPPKARDLATLEAYRNVGAVLKGYTDSLTIATDDREVAVNQAFNTNIDKIIGPDQIIEGSMTGKLLAINLHNTTRFEIYPPAGPAKVACNFSNQMKPRVIAGLDRNVRVIGRLRYKHWAPYPHAITVEDIEIFPPNDTLPTLTSLRGLALKENTNPDGREA